MPPVRSPLKPPSFIAELYDFAKNSAAVPYAELFQHYTDAGWVWFLRQTALDCLADASVVLSFDLLIGRDVAVLERLDTISIHLPAAPGPVSLVGRLQAQQTAMYLISGQMPPMPNPAQQAAPAPHPATTNGSGRPLEPTQHTSDMVRRTTVDMSAGDAALPAETEYMIDERPAVKVVERREPDGLPIFRDLYAIGAPEVRDTGDIVSAVLDEVASFLAGASGVEQIDALAAKNTEMIDFVRDFGEEIDVKDLRAMVEKRRNELARPAGAVPRRRASAAPRTN